MYLQKDDGMKISLKFLISMLVFTLLLPAVSFAVPMFTITANSPSLNLLNNQSGVVTFTVINSIGTDVSGNITYTANIAPNPPFQSSVSSTCGVSLLKGQSCQLDINVQATSQTGNGHLQPRVCYHNDCSTTLAGPLITVTKALPLTFTPCGATGANGPTISQCNAAYANTPLAGQVTISGSGIQHWTVPRTGTYRIEAFGAQGASAEGNGIVGGLGADIRGDFTLTAGQVRYCRWTDGHRASSGSNAGGGGGSFVVTSTGTILVIAGGGRTRGERHWVECHIGQQQEGNDSGDGIPEHTAGTGVEVDRPVPGSGGGGYSGNGTNDGSNGTGGMSFINGAQGVKVSNAVFSMALRYGGRQWMLRRWWWRWLLRWRRWVYRWGGASFNSGVLPLNTASTIR